MSYPLVTGVTFVRKELQDILPIYSKIEDCLAGESVVKSRGTLYLPDPSPHSCDEGERKRRYEAYLMRSVFFNIARHTMEGLVGQVFSKETVVKVPDIMLPIVRNASGDGVSLVQMARKTLEGLLGFSRDGLLVDFPTMSRPASRAEVVQGAIRPTITRYKASHIRNWKVTDIGAEEVPTLVTLLEWHELPVEGSEFAVQMVPCYRVLRLTTEGATVQIYRPKTLSNLVAEEYSDFEGGPVQHILGSDGRPLSRLPFKILGGTRNAFEIERPSFEDLATINLAHYRNSADYEELAFMLGQGSLFATGLTEEWAKNVLDNKIQVGSRSLTPLPAGATVELLQIKESGLLAEAMAAKEKQAQALGAKMVEPTKTQMTATEAKIEATAEGSVLQNAARNASDGYLWALNLSAQLLGITGEIEFKLNDDFDISKMSSADRSDVRSAHNDKVLTWSEARAVYRAAGIATLDDDEAKKELAETDEAELKNEVERERLLNVPN